jgi:mono/diheme cytochrome c family protein
MPTDMPPEDIRQEGRRVSRRLHYVMFLIAGLAAAPPALAQGPMGITEEEEIHVVRPGRPDIVMPALNAARGRVYFATRACVVCHQVNGIGGTLAPALGRSDEQIELFEFITSMWRGARSMVELQDSLFGEAIDLAPDEMADIIAFLYDPAEQKKFSENDVPRFIREFMATHSGAPVPSPAEP